VFTAVVLPDMKSPGPLEKWRCPRGAKSTDPSVMGESGSTYRTMARSLNHPLLTN
jgi:hypothetical protein